MLTIRLKRAFSEICRKCRAAVLRWVECQNPKPYNPRPSPLKNKTLNPATLNLQHQQSQVVRNPGSSTASPCGQHLRAGAYVCEVHSIAFLVLKTPRGHWNTLNPKA